MLRRRTLSLNFTYLLLLTTHEKRFYPAGNYTWTVPDGCTEVDVFLVGGGGGSGGALGYYKHGAGGGYTSTFKKDNIGWKDGDAISVTPGEKINIIVGAGGLNDNGGFSLFKNSNYRAYGGGKSYLMNSSNPPYGFAAGPGGSGGGAYSSAGGSDGSDGLSYNSSTVGAQGQGHTTRDFGEPNGKRNAGAGGGEHGSGGESDYTEGSGDSSSGYGGGGYGGGGGAAYDGYYTKGGDGTVLIRYIESKIIKVPIKKHEYFTEITKIGQTIWTVPPGCTQMDVCIVAGGKNGANSDYYTSGSGGSGGQVINIYNYKTIPGTQLNMTVGGPNLNSIFLNNISYSGHGGAGGKGKYDGNFSDVCNGSPGSNGVKAFDGKYNKYLSYYGAGGGAGAHIRGWGYGYFYGGSGGESGGGAGGDNPDTVGIIINGSPGKPGTFYGAGGGGASKSCNSGSIDGTGGAGYQGIIIMHYYA